MLFKIILKKIKKSFLEFWIFKYFITLIIIYYLKLVYYTNNLIKESDDPKDAHKKYNPFIITFWHGQHIMGLFLRPDKEKIVAMFSKSFDAELNANIGKKFGLKIIRGSGGKKKYDIKKGGVKALLLLKRALNSGSSTVIIADVSDKPKESGKGIILLAKISGRPIIPYVYSFSRNKILKNTWDKTAIPLPFGKSIFLMGDAIYVPKNANKLLLEKKRIMLTKSMNFLTKKSYFLLNKFK